MAAIGGATLGVAGVAALVARMTRAREPGRIVQWRSDELHYDEIVSGASMAMVRGDPQHGAHAVFTRMQPGFRLPRHIHTHDMMIVVIRGAYLYGADGEEERRVEAGSCLFMPGGVPHWSGADATEGALFFETSEGAFDLRILD
jgi:quercetin dioxygenase-like cupin family protein